MVRRRIRAALLLLADVLLRQRLLQMVLAAEHRLFNFLDCVVKVHGRDVLSRGLAQRISVRHVHARLAHSLLHLTLHLSLQVDAAPELQVQVSIRLHRHKRAHQHITRRVKSITPRGHSLFHVERVTSVAQRQRQRVEQVDVFILHRGAVVVLSSLGGPSLHVDFVFDVHLLARLELHKPVADSFEVLFIHFLHY